jgi:lactate dehydrogenase-like 2-hydroxyacid dehydrogenase
MPDSDSTVSGYSYTQENLIDIIKDEVRNIITLESTLTSTIHQDVNSLHQIDEEHIANIEELAAWCDFLVLCAPAGPQTFHIVNRKVLNLLGPDGVLVNVARGSLVDTVELAEAIKAKAIAGAALDVYEGEPTLPPALIELDDVVITPHIAGLSPEAMQAAVERVIENLQCHVNGQPLISPV